MARFSPRFIKTIRHLAIIGFISLAGLTAGSWFYIHQLSASQQVPVKNMKATLAQSLSHDITLHFLGVKKIIVKKETIQQWVEPYHRSYSGQDDVRLSDRLSDYLQKISTTVGTEPQDTRFIIENGKVRIIAPSREGTRLDIALADAIIRQALLANLSDVTIPLDKTAPAITEEKIFSLGINQKLASGQSNFTGSSPARIQNISVASALYNGLLIPAGQTFSFNTILGEVDAEHGYAPEKVIKSNKIEYEYGGGICQVSTTVFRAAIAAGFPIVERKPHAFPVVYYSPQGFDATIYPGVSDLRFINDTGSYVLVQIKLFGKNLYVDMYGTSDGRSVAVTTPEQYDVQPDGSMKAFFTRTISRADGTVKEERFNSSYKSPSLYPTQPNPYQ